MPIPSPQSETTILDFLKALGLSEDQAQIYLTLSKTGPLSNLELSRQASIPRTNIYRYVEDMRHQGLIEEVAMQTGDTSGKSTPKTKSQATPPDRLEKILHERESQLKFLNQKFPLVAHHLDKVQEEVASQNHGQPTETVFFRGKEGVKQMFWNTLRAQKEILTLTHRPMEEYVNKSLLEEFWREFDQKNLTLRNLSSTQVYSKRKKYSEFVRPLIGKEKPAKKQKPNFYSRIISPETLEIDMQITIYNDVIAFYNWHEGEIFGTEIHNEKVARFQKQMFEVLWRLGE